MVGDELERSLRWLEMSWRCRRTCALELLKDDGEEEVDNEEAAEDDDE